MHALLRRALLSGQRFRMSLSVALLTTFLLSHVPLASCQTGSTGMGQYAALPWSLLWLNPSYTGFYGGLGNVGQLTPDSAYLFGAGGQIGVGGVRGYNGGGGGYNYGLGAYNHAGASSFSLVLIFTSFLVLACLRF
ncbi:uncharacterized protein LOC129587341 [Paramacrobiotus metropolitanus]|uniref:uncharacterized protein LOC129587341 n=1 Tax=Paramacrobiotus metropolitanus TaxID=2943436 RepID=UPI002445C65F|nr:uncharacterized protein LOC129587341 [Paramacrobiotus metropolitanus]XP_055337021.1 uncharacterized protein LOC129587341 [Paramacrobiotus metropolitanus]XP_055337022.1 uncharacterized protein LOC129587341 [Paramacrobiotus metropolitanus]